MIEERVGQLYGGKQQAECPGDGNSLKGIAPCPEWQRAAGSTHEEKIKSGVCALCEKCQGRAPGSSSWSGSHLHLRRIERLVSEKRTFGLDRCFLNAWEVEGLLLWDDVMDSYRRAHEKRLEFICEVLMALLKVRGVG